MRTLKHIAIAGNIGAGKTTLSELLSRHYNWDVQFEDTTMNPYLSDFYDDMHRWSFNLQIYFLNSRFEQIMKIRQGQQTVIQDRTIYEDAHIFAPNLHDMNLMTSRDFENYFSLFKLMASQIEPPDLLIYLKSSIPKLVHHIQTRGRDYEGNMSLDYLKRLNGKYEAWIDNYTAGRLLIIQNDDLDFKNNPEDLGLIIEKVDAEIHGLF
ncbi:MAG: deoxynucleoside kinase [Saprospiraceae bacterium]|jgi:deoxyadenosine/deoxycytidine kinase|nr:deoxynucleoside kinase [Saprospiraceae bacterium]